MPAQTRRSVYQQAVHITDSYLGPAAERFVDRQVRSHLHKEPEDITEKDLENLIHWFRLAVSVLTDDNRIVEEYITQLEVLAHKPQLSNK
jgi:hypothetical protein